ncbi:MAG: hypothetical protein ABFD18_00770 [Syntrophomonas sp.]
MKKKIFLPLVLLLVLSLVTGCGGGTTVNTKDGSVTYEKDKATFEAKDGSKAEVNVADGEGEEASLPDDYPEDLLPIIGGAKIVLANKNEINQQSSYLISLSSSKSPQDVYDFYKDKLKDLEDLSTSQTNDLFTVNGFKGDQHLSVIITPEEDKNSSIQLGIGPKM